MVGIAPGARTCDVAKRGGGAGGATHCKAGFESHIHTQKVSLKSNGDISLAKHPRHYSNDLPE